MDEPLEKPVNNTAPKALAIGLRDHDASVDERYAGEPSRLDGLDALRGIAALIVLVGHATLFSRGWFPAFHLHLAVDLFFMLSGYVMARAYEPRLADDPMGAAFLEARVRRIWPTMAAGTAVGAALCLPLGADAAAIAPVFLQSLFLIPAISGNTPLFLINTPAWSIFFELFANAVHVIALRRMNCIQIAMLQFTCMALLLAFQSAPNPGCMGSDFLLGFPRVLVSYGFGIVLWRLLRDRAFLPAWPGLMALPAALFLPPLFGDGVWLDWIFMLAIAPFCIVAGLGRPPLPKLFRFLGKLSFPLYAVHGPVVLFLGTQGYGMLTCVVGGLGAGWLLMTAFDLARTRRGLPGKSLGTPRPA